MSLGLPHPQLNQFFSIFLKTLVEHMDEGDSYVYLNATRGLSAMGNAYTDRLLPLLLSRFHTAPAFSNSIEFRLKVGEAIVRVLRDLGRCQLI